MSSLDCSHTLIISDSGIKNNVATSITYIHVCDRPIVKTIHHAANITSTEAKLFAIRCGINQAVNLPGISKIVIITNSLHAAKKIFDSSIYSFQMHSAAISKELPKFFNANNENSIVFWKLTATGLCSYLLTETPNNIDKFRCSHASHLETLARKANMTI